MEMKTRSVVMERIKSFLLALIIILILFNGVLISQAILITVTPKKYYDYILTYSCSCDRLKPFYDKDGYLIGTENLGPPEDLKGCSGCGYWAQDIKHNREIKAIEKQDRNQPALIPFLASLIVLILFLTAYILFPILILFVIIFSIYFYFHDK